MSKFPDFNYVKIEVLLNGKVVTPKFISENLELFINHPTHIEVINYRNQIIQNRKDEDEYLIRVSENGLDKFKL